MCWSNYNFLQISNSLGSKLEHEDECLKIGQINRYHVGSGHDAVKGKMLVTNSPSFITVSVSCMVRYNNATQIYGPLSN